MRAARTHNANVHTGTRTNSRSHTLNTNNIIYTHIFFIKRVIVKSLQ